jgi:hypothetical protein
MSAPSEAVPTLELPSAALMQWSQMALLLAFQLAGRREQLDRLAWSDSEHAARAHDLAELRDTIEPAVRAMTAGETAQWPTGSDDAAGATTPVTAEVAPLNDRWGLRATAGGEDTVSPVWVSCRDEELARGLASEIVARGEPAAVLASAPTSSSVSRSPPRLRAVRRRWTAMRWPRTSAVRGRPRPLPRP